MSIITLTTDFGTTNDLVSDIEYSPDSTMVAVTVGREDNSEPNDGGLVILDTTDWSEIGRFDPSSKDSNYDSIEWSPDGSILALGGAGEVFLLDPNNFCTAFSSIESPTWVEVPCALTYPMSSEFNCDSLRAISIALKPPLPSSDGFVIWNASPDNP